MLTRRRRNRTGLQAALRRICGPCAAGEGGSAAGRSGSTRSGAKQQAAGPGGKRAAGTKPKAQASASRAKPRAGAKARPKAAPRRTRREQEEPVPRQGFASDEDRASGPVQPPGGQELLATAAEIVSELAKAGAGAGERLVRDIISRLPGS